MFVLQFKNITNKLEGWIDKTIFAFQHYGKYKVSDTEVHSCRSLRIKISIFGRKKEKQQHLCSFFFFDIYDIIK